MIVKYRQENGLSVLLEPIESVVSVSVGLWIRKGSRNERENQYGYAHFVEHMLFKGTEKYSARELARKVDRVGGQHNAATNREYTCYYINVVSDHLELALEILSDMYYNSLFEQGEIEKERNVVVEEIRMYEDTPDEFIHDYFMEKMMEGHPLSHSILGTVDGILSTDREKLITFYDEQYVNENAILVIAGDLNSDHTKDLISKYFDRNRGKGIVQGKTVSDIPANIPVEHIDRDLEQVHFCMGLPGLRRADEDRWPMYMLNTILGGSMSSRLFQNIREKEGISYSIYSFHSSYMDCGIFGIYCATLPEKYSYTLELIMKECRSMLKDSITREEFEDTKTYLKGNLALSLENNEVRMSQLARNEMTFGRNFTFEEIVSTIDSVTMDQYVSVCERILNGREFSLISLGKLKKKERATPDLRI